MASIIKVTEILHPTANVPSLTINSDSTVSFDAGILSVTGPINGVIGANTPYSGTFTNLSYSGTLTGNTGIINIGSGQIYKDVNGQIGIGTSSPGYRLDVAAGDTTANVGYAMRLRSNATANAATLQFTNSGVTVENGYIRVTDTGLMSLSNKAYITSAGDVGIGTASPLGILDARGAVYLGNTSSGTTTFVRGAPNWNFAGLNVIRNASNTGTPRSIGMALDGDDLASTTIGAYNAIWGAYDSSPTTGSTSSALNGAMVYGAYAGHRWVTNGSERMRIDSSGNVGIGTSSPTEKLDVSGNVKVSGSLSVAGNNISPQTGFKNRIINGDFSVWQRGTTRYSNSGMAASAKYYADRWTSGQFQNAAFERVDRTTAGPASKYAMRVSSSSAAEDGSGTRMTLGQLIEHLNCADLAEKSITLSFWVRFSASSIASYGSFNYSLWQQDSVDLAFDSNGPTRSDTLTLTNGSFPTTWTKLTLVVTTASTMKNLAVQFSFSNLANTASNGSFWYEIAEVQLEKGSTATPFEFRSIGTELALCQRYYELSYPTGFSPGYNFSESYPFSTSKPIALNLVASDDTVTSQTIRFVVQKRASPTVVIYSASNGASGSTFTYKGTGGSAINLAASVTYTSQDLWNINQSLGAINQTNESYLHFTASAEL